MINRLRVTEYQLYCDKCDAAETVFTYDGGGRLPEGRQVHSEQDAIRCADWHMTKDGLLCRECFEKKKKEIMEVYQKHLGGVLPA